MCVCMCVCVWCEFLRSKAILTYPVQIILYKIKDIFIKSNVLFFQLCQSAI